MRVIPLTKREQFEKIKQLNRLMVKLNKDYMRKYTSECGNLILNNIQVDYKTKDSKWFSYNEYLFVAEIWKNVLLMFNEKLK
ncbi:hypothetical protein ACV3Q3_12870 [Clostridium perfringens]